jgi:pimeloyl-ACP methyl ester carboxylesterase
MGGGIVAHLLARHPDRFLTASFGGSGVREDDEALAQQAAALDPKGHDPQQEAGQASLRERPDRDNDALKAVQDGRIAKPSTAPPLDLTSLDFPIQAINGEFDAPVSKTQRLAREAKEFTNVILPGRGHNTVTTWPFTPRLYVDAIAGFIRAHDPR